MHKRILDFHRPLLFVLLTTLLFPTIANAADHTAPVGKEQPPAFDRLEDIPPSSDTLGFGYQYTVQAGDDVWLIAVSHGISMEALVEINGLEAPYWIYPGDKLWVPAAPAEIKRAPTPTPTPEPTATPAPQPTPPSAAPQSIEQAPAPASEEAPAEQGEAAQPEATPLPEAASQPITPTEPVAVASAPVAPVLSDPAALILNQMNEKRTAYGLPALTWSAELAAAAQGHAEDCAGRGWGSHTGSDGAHLRTRLARQGYYPSWASENWANARSAQHAFDMWWYEGPGGVHYENIMGRNYTQAGVGIAKGGWGYYYIVDFGAP